MEFSALIRKGKRNLAGNCKQQKVLNFATFPHPSSFLAFRLRSLMAGFCVVARKSPRAFSNYILPSPIPATMDAMRYANEYK
jgi:hypothetical protein